MASRILTQFKQRLNSLELEPSDGGCFEVSTDGELIYSKLQTGQFPDEDEVVSAVQERLG